MTRGEDTRGTKGDGTHIGTLNIGRARVNSDGRDTMNMQGAPWCPPCPDGHPWVVTQSAMVVAIEVRLGGTQERSVWEGGVQCARLLFRRWLVALFALFLAFLSCAGFV